MDECEFKALCDPEGLACQGDLKDCPMAKLVHDYLSSPQFKKESEEKIRKAIDDFREELVEGVKRLLTKATGLNEVVRLIRTHELKEE